MAKGKKRPAELPEYGTVMMKGVQISDLKGNYVQISSSCVLCHDRVAQYEQACHFAVMPAKCPC